MNKNHFQDCEGGDRLEYGLPFGQDELIEALLGVNKNLVLVLLSGNAVEMPWASVGLSTVRKQYDLLNAYEYATALNDIRGSSTISAEDLEAYKNGTKGINWTDLLTRTGITQDYRLAISGGNEKVKYGA